MDIWTLPIRYLQFFCKYLGRHFSKIKPSRLIRITKVYKVRNEKTKIEKKNVRENGMMIKK